MQLVTHLRAALPRLIGSFTAFAILLSSSPFAYGAMPEGAKIYYYLHDHLGGIHKVLDEEGNVVEENDYLPFGEERVSVNSGGQDEDYGFTGKEKDEETGLNYYGARYYDGEIGRFTTVDPLILSEAVTIEQELEDILKNPQMLNAYTYALNNPVVWKDLWGESPASDIAAGAGQILDGTQQILTGLGITMLAKKNTRIAIFGTARFLMGVEDFANGALKIVGTIIKGEALEAPKIIKKLKNMAKSLLNSPVKLPPLAKKLIFAIDNLGEESLEKTVKSLEEIVKSSQNQAKEQGDKADNKKNNSDQNKEKAKKKTKKSKK